MKGKQVELTIANKFIGDRNNEIIGLDKETIKEIGATIDNKTELITLDNYPIRGKVQEIDREFESEKLVQISLEIKRSLGLTHGMRIIVRDPVLFSHSQLSMFEECQYNYYLRHYVRKLISPYELAKEISNEPRKLDDYNRNKEHLILDHIFIGQFMGNVLHDCMNKFYLKKNLGKFNSDTDYFKEFDEVYDKLYKIIKKDLKCKFHKPKPHKDKEYFRTAGKMWIKDAIRKYPPDREDTYFLEKDRVETKVWYDFRDFAMRGYIDRIIKRSDEHFIILDYKTSLTDLSGWNSIYWMTGIKKPLDRQMLIYKKGLLNRAGWGDNSNKQIDLKWYYTKWKAEITCGYSDKRSEWIEKSMIKTIEDINSCMRKELQNKERTEIIWKRCNGSGCKACSPDGTPTLGKGDNM